MSEDTGKEIDAANQDTSLTQDPVGITVDNWREVLPENLRNEKVIQDTKDLTTMAKRLVDANKYISSSIRLPDDGDTSGMDELYNKLGRPETVEGYKVERPQMPEGVKYNEDLEKTFLGIAHKVGLNSSQVNELIKWNQEQSVSMAADQRNSTVQAMNNLKKEWGNAFDERVKIAEEVLNQYGNDEIEALARDNAPLINILYEMGKNLVEGSVEGKAVSSHIRTPDEAQKKIRELQANKEWMKIYMQDKRHPNHDAYVEEMRQLMAEAYPEPEPVVY